MMHPVMSQRLKYPLMLQVTRQCISQRLDLDAHSLPLGLPPEESLQTNIIKATLDDP